MNRAVHREPSSRRAPVLPSARPGGSRDRQHGSRPALLRAVSRVRKRHPHGGRVVVRPARRPHRVRLVAGCSRIGRPVGRTRRTPCPAEEGTRASFAPLTRAGNSPPHLDSRRDRHPHRVGRVHSSRTVGSPAHLMVGDIAPRAVRLRMGPIRKRIRRAPPPGRDRCAMVGDDHGDHSDGRHAQAYPTVLARDHRRGSHRNDRWIAIARAHGATLHPSMFAVARGGGGAGLLEALVGATIITLRGEPARPQPGQVG